MVYGEGERIFCMTSANNGLTFSEPVMVGQIKEMHLGHTRGPQITSSKNFTMISAIDKAGTVHSFRLNHSTKQWSKSANVNDIKGSAVEGLMALAADKEDNFYAVWLDIRMEKKNNIFFSSINGKSSAWSKNLMIYKSPEGHVCECCRPNITYSNNRLVVGFRNWLMGSRDVYYSVSINKGKSFSEPKKSGTDTWRLNACPMDGGGLSINESGIVSTAWRRNSEVYFWSEKKAEMKVGTGRDVSMAQIKNRTIIAWQDNKTVKVREVNTETTMEIGNGISPRVYVMPNGKILCVWEDDRQVKFKAI